MALSLFVPTAGETPQLNQPVLLAYKSGNRWEVIQDTWKGNLPQGQTLITPQQAKQYMLDNAASLQGEIDAYARGGQTSESVIGPMKAQIADFQNKAASYDSFTPQQGGIQYETNPATGEIIAQSSLPYVSPEQGLAESQQKAIAMGGMSPEQLAAYNAQNQAAGGIDPNAAPSVYNVPTGGGGTYSGTPSGAPAGTELARYTGTSAGTTPQAVLDKGWALLSQSQTAPQTPQTNLPLTSGALASTPSYNFQTPQQTPEFPVAGLNTNVPGVSSTGQYQMTESEKKAQDFTTRVMELNNKLLGESTYRTEQENAAGLPDLLRTQQDLSNQLKALQAEAKAIPLKAQQQSEGRGITAAGLRPIEAAAARNNAIQALSVGAMLEASQGNITTALALIDRAVAQKYDPIKEEIKVTMANLELILNSPQASIEDKNRAMAQMEIQRAKQAAVEQAESNQKDIQQIAIDAAASGADALTLQKISQAQTPLEAVQIAAAAGLFQTEQDTQLVNLGDGRAVLMNMQTGEIIKDIGGGSTGGGITGGSGTTGGYKAGLLTQLLQSQGMPTDDASLAALYKQIGGQGTYVNDVAHNSQIYAALGGQQTQTISDVTGKPLSDAERTSLGYANRLVEADATIDTLGSKFTGYSSYFGQLLPNALQSDERQQFEQAKRNFINAVLRRESGAVISPSEFENAEKQYFPQPGDSPAVLAQKDANRAMVIKNLQLSGGQTSAPPPSNGDPLGIL